MITFRIAMHVFLALQFRSASHSNIMDYTHLIDTIRQH